ncbi:PREDICTED: ribonuclease P protein subunit rpr2-like [Nicrophorus vespilloides]|uniref:Ribonuclease P protein subunit rpr2-like n=1 Tax=Nicrophorus vespilloides TaxID=110193 RepID=A0ABM1N476_NICVS|nr:PREDICTED: ribonuclease P protein subunit rpr2-like [Nicrophorus vespilloides]
MSKATKKCVGKESFLRMNYLYQLSTLSLKQGQQTASNAYSNLMINISKKSVQRIEPTIKRTICKTCNQLLVPGQTCRVRIKNKTIKYVCTICNAKKSYIARKDYELWCDKKGALVEVLDYSMPAKCIPEEGKEEEREETIPKIIT